MASLGPENRMTMKHRAKEILDFFGRTYPWLWDEVARIRAEHASEIGTDSWPTHTFLPLERAALPTARILAGEDPGTATTHRGIQLSSNIATLAAWRMTQGIYRVDPTLYRYLVDTPITGPLPADVLLLLPEWCIYVETPGMAVESTDGDSLLYGVFAWIDHHPDGTDILTLAMDAEGATGFTHVPLVGTLEDALRRVVDDWREAMVRGNALYTPPEGFEVKAAAFLAPILSLLMYICSQVGEITGNRGGPGNPEPVETRKGHRLFPASTPAVWDVGVRMGAALTSALAAMEDSDGPPTGRTVRPHIRRAHWHTFLSGPRKGAAPQRRDIRWMPPIPVKVDDLDELPAVVRPVKGGL